MLKLSLYIGLAITFAACTKADKPDEIDLDNIQMAHWYEGKRCAFTFTFDDNTPKHKDIGDLLSEHHMKGSFYINPGFPNFQDYKHLYIELLKDGHEIGNHTYYHKNLVNTDPAETEMQVKKGAEAIEQELGKYPISFVHPYNATSDKVNNIVYKYHLFARIASPYNLDKRKVYDVNATWPVLEEVKDVINTWDNYWIIIAGHGYGENDMSWDFLENLCKELESRDDVWIEKFSVVAAYDYLREEVIVNKKIVNDSLFIEIENFDSVKYKILEKLPITIKVPVLTGISLTTDQPEVKVQYHEKAYYFNFDLKKTRRIRIVKY